MIDRYSRENMKKIWDLTSKFNYYLQVELAVCDAYVENGTFPKNDIEQLKKLAKFDLKRIDEIEQEVRHDVIAFLTNVNENLGDLGKYMHVGMTSSDVIDTAFALQIKDSGEIIKEDILGEHYDEFDSLLVLAHFKGHPMAGFGGSLKQLSIGVASSFGKAYIHGAGEPEKIWTAEHDKFLLSMADSANSIVNNFTSLKSGVSRYLI